MHCQFACFRFPRWVWFLRSNLVTCICGFLVLAIFLKFKTHDRILPIAPCPSIECGKWKVSRASVTARKAADASSADQQPCHPNHDSATGQNKEKFSRALRNCWSGLPSTSPVLWIQKGRRAQFGFPAPRNMFKQKIDWRSPALHMDGSQPH